MSDDLQVISAICRDASLASEDKLLLTFIAAEQAGGCRVTHDRLSELIGILPASVARRLRKLRERGIIDSERVGPHEWRYDFIASDWGLGGDEARDGVTLQQGHSESDPTPYKNVFDLFTGERVGQREDGEVSSPSAVTDHPASQTQEEDVASAEDEAILDKILAQLDDPPDGEKGAPVKERFTVPKSKRRNAVARFEAKEPKQYKVPDLEILFKKEWEAAELPGRPFSWTAKDRGQMKRMITDQGAEAVAKMISYVLRNWPAMKRRYNLTGAPTPAAMYGFRRSWLPEALEGPKDEKPKGPAEWDGDTDGDDLDETGWGGL